MRDKWSKKTSQLPYLDLVLLPGLDDFTHALLELGVLDPAGELRQRLEDGKRGCDHDRVTGRFDDPMHPVRAAA